MTVQKKRNLDSSQSNLDTRTHSVQKEENLDSSPPNLDTRPYIDNPLDVTPLTKPRTQNVTPKTKPRTQNYSKVKDKLAEIAQRQRQTPETPMRLKPSKPILPKPTLTRNPHPKPTLTRNSHPKPTLTRTPNPKPKLTNEIKTPKRKLNQMISDFEQRDKKARTESEINSERQKKPRMRQLSVIEGFAMRQKKEGLETGSQTVASGSIFKFTSLISCTLGLNEKGESADDAKVAVRQPVGRAEQGGGEVRGELTCSALELNTCAASTHPTVQWVGTTALARTSTVGARLHSQEAIQGAEYLDCGDLSGDLSALH